MGGGGPVSTGRPAQNGGSKALERQYLEVERLAIDNLPPPPAYFGSRARKIYAEIIRTLARDRAICEGDVALIIMAARAWERWETLDREIKAEDAETAPGKSGGAYMSGKAQARSAALKEYRMLAADLKMSPRARYAMTGTAQTDFLDLLAPPKPAKTVEDGGPLDPFRPLSIEMPASRPN